MDDCNWKIDWWNEIREKTIPFLHQCGYTDDDITWVPISGLSGENFKTKTDKSPWYDGPSFLDVLDQLPIPPRDETKPLRIPILDKMTDRGVIVFGKVEQGIVELGTKLTIAPSLKTAQVLSIFNSKEELVRYAKPGENVKLRLGGLQDESEVRKGDVICPRDDTLPITEIFIAEIKVL